MAAIRLDGKPDKIQSILSSSLMDRDLALLASQDRSMYPLASSSWEEVSPKDLLITPVQCKALWRRFKSETEYAVTQAISAQEAYKQSNNWLPPPWAIVAMAILGFNEFMLLLKNPLYVLVLFVGYLLSKAIWVNMDIQGEFRHGAVNSQLINNVCTDALSAEKYYYFIRLMGQRASHVALECTLQSHPNMAWNHVARFLGSSTWMWSLYHLHMDDEELNVELYCIDFFFF